MSPVKRAVISLLLACAASAGAGPVEVASLPPLPSPVAPATIADTPALPPPDPVAPARPRARRRRPAPPKIRLGEKRLTDEPCRSGVGLTTPGEAEAKVEGNQLLTVVTGTSASHTFPFCPHSDFVSTVRLVQEFEVVPGPGGAGFVVLSMAGRLDGYLRSENHGSAHLRRAEAVLSPADGGPGLVVGFPPAYVSGDCVLRCESETQSPTLLAPPGRYVLVVTLVTETTADGLFRGHAEAVFEPESRAGSWTSHGDNQPPDLEEGKDFGLAVTVRADAPPPG